jgi:mRNA-degrading endonuclease toxin of MazEF toxin-antitoxin module
LETVSWPEPEAGLVIRYSYLWGSEFDAGGEEGVKDRPCAVIVALRQIDGTDSVLVVPITHSPPTDTASAVEIPLAIKKRLKLDAERSWVVLTESNTFTWPGPDLRPISGRADHSIAYGQLPQNFFVELRRQFVILERAKRSRRISRTE